MDKKAEIKKLAKRTKSLRIERGYTRYENFAFDNKIHRAQYGRYEIGTDMQFTSPPKIARAFDMALEEFFSEGFD